jgi:hypothetical protein
MHCVSTECEQLNKAVDSIDIGVLGLVEPVGKHGQHFVGNVRAAWTSIIIAAGFTLQVIYMFVF